MHRFTRRSRQVLVSVDAKLYLVAVPIIGGQTPTVSISKADDAPVPARRLTRVGGDFLGWSPDGRLVLLVARPLLLQVRRRRVHDGVSPTRPRAPTVSRRHDAKPDTSKANARSPRYAYAAKRFDVTMIVPQGSAERARVVLSGARIVTMKGDEIIPTGRHRRHEQPHRRRWPDGEASPSPRVHAEIDVRGKTIIPGYVDIHSHMWPTWGIHKTQVYEYLVNLAYGVTTTRDPQTSTTDVLTYGDLVETGDMLGPRIFTTGPGVFWTDRGLAVRPTPVRC